MSHLSLPDIPPLNEHVAEETQARQDTLVKPVGALGELERLSVRIAGMTGRADWLPARRAVVVCAGDHGVVQQGVSTVPSAITAYMVQQFLSGTAAISVLARQMGARLTVVDAGVAGDLPDHAQLVRGRIANGTADFTLGSAMTPDQAGQSIQLGLDVAQQEIARGLDLLAIGEMGIGNTTTASAAEVTGRGTGISDAQLAQKIWVVEQALALHAPASVDTLVKVGGFEIGAMAGLMIGAASQRVPVVIDGLICTSAALIAAQLKPQVAQYLIAGHRSAEPGHQIALEYLGLRPLLDLNMRLGEGTGAVLSIPIIEAAMRTVQEMAVLAL